jgi:ribosomal protein S18 acetylase RimI-like enzyme
LSSNGIDALRVVRADPAQRDALAALMAVAFNEDPVSVWLFPDASSREGTQRRFFALFLDMAFEAGEVYTTDSGHGVTLWLSVNPADEADDVAAAMFDERMREALGAYADRFAVLGALMDAAHPSHEEHQYMPFIAVAPPHQGTGIGTRLLADRLALLDSTDTASYLEASCPRNQKLYEQLGFQQIGAPIDLPGGPQQLIPMWRPAGAEDVITSVISISGSSVRSRGGFVSAEELDEEALIDKVGTSTTQTRAGRHVGHRPQS